MISYGRNKKLKSFTYTAQKEWLPLDTIDWILESDVIQFY